MKSANPQFGLVLTGGGAKGAYQAGALRYLAEIGLEPHIIAGTSIGALNGAVLSSHGSFPVGVRRVNELWEQLGTAPILRPNTGAVLHTFSYVSQTFVLFDPAPIEQLLRESVNPTALRYGIELWVTVFPSLKIPGLGYDWLIDFVRAKTGTDAHWLCVQDFADEDTLYNLLLASAALPLAFPSREVNGKSYVDGGLADNVPLRALAARGCTHAIIIHLQNGAVWSRHDFPEQTIIEIRPEQPINTSDTPLIGLVDSWLNFSAERIAELKHRGYEDASSCLEPIILSSRTVREQRQAHNSMVDSTTLLLNDCSSPKSFGDSALPH